MQPGSGPAVYILRCYTVYSSKWRHFRTPSNDRVPHRMLTCFLRPSGYSPSPCLLCFPLSLPTSRLLPKQTQGDHCGCRPLPCSVQLAAFPGTLLPWPDASRATMGGNFSEAAFLAPWQLGKLPPTSGGEKRADATLLLLPVSCCPNKFLRTYCKNGNRHSSIHCSQGPQDSKFVPGRRALNFWMVHVEHWAQAGRQRTDILAFRISVNHSL